MRYRAALSIPRKPENRKRFVSARSAPTESNVQVAGCGEVTGEVPAQGGRVLDALVLGEV